MPGDILPSIESRDITPPDHPVFSMGKRTTLEIVGKDEQRHTVSVNVARPKGKKLHFIQPTLVEPDAGRRIGISEDCDVPRTVGVEVANTISIAAQNLGAVESLIIVETRAQA